MPGNNVTSECLQQRMRERQQLTGLRPSSPAVAASPVRLHLSLFRDLQRIVDLDPEVSDGAFEFAVTEQ
jgi:hypothetical protein